jgi:hypothetical protein
MATTMWMATMLATAAGVAGCAGGKAGGPAVVAPGGAAAGGAAGEGKGGANDTAGAQPAGAGGDAAGAARDQAGTAAGAAGAAAPGNDKGAAKAAARPAGAGDATKDKAAARDAGDDRSGGRGRDKDQRSADGRPLIRVGSGSRAVDGAKVYDMALWVDEQDARRAFPALVMRAGGRDRARLMRGDHAPAFLVWGRFTKQAVLKFARATPAKELRAELAPAFEGIAGSEAVLDLFGDAASGDEWVLTTGDNGQVELAGPGAPPKKVVTSPKLVRALWSAWLGPKVDAPELRQALIGRIDILGR